MIELKGVMIASPLPFQNTVTTKQVRVPKANIEQDCGREQKGETRGWASQTEQSWCTSRRRRPAQVHPQLPCAHPAMGVLLDAVSLRNMGCMTQ